MMNRDPLELYIHIPFCVRKCRYCDFLSAPSNERERQLYIESLCQKIRSYGELAEAYRVVSIFLGGGTPSILTSEQIEEIFLAIRDTFFVEEDAEITIEMNPGTVTREKLMTYQKCGINRLSIGLQSAENLELEALGRIHTYEEFLDTYRMVRDMGFQNVNVDLMSAVPHQTRESWKRTLERVVSLQPPPEHISAYSLIIEEGTPFYERYGDGGHAEELPDEEEERQMYRDTTDVLKAYGYHRYEISNYAKEGYECRHNLGYWNRAEYLGIGAGAASLLKNCRYQESDTMAGVRSQSEELTCQSQPEVLALQNQMEEYMFLGLRKMEGVSVSRFENLYGSSMKDIYGDVLRRMLEEELLEIKGDYVRLTERGIDVSNYVMSEFLF